MTTKPPSKVQEAPAGSLEKIAYASVAGIATVEPNDRVRLGYHVWRFLEFREGTLESIIKESGARLNISRKEAQYLITESLKEQGITV